MIKNPQCGMDVPWSSSPEWPNNSSNVNGVNGRPKGKLIFTVPNINKQINSKENVSSKQSLGGRTDRTDWAAVLAEGEMGNSSFCRPVIKVL